MKAEAQPTKDMNEPTIPADNQNAPMAVASGAVLGGERKSKYHGVYWKKRKNPKWSKWCAMIHIYGKCKCIGQYDNEEDAAAAFDAELLKRDGVEAKRNFLIGGIAA
jgi:hypothetical protein